MRVILSKPRGFCAGVTRAIDIVELALKKYGPPVYVRHEIVHNKRVVEDLKAKGAVFVEELDEVPDGAHTVFSAHGVSKKVADVAGARDLPVIDATCPLVAKVHKEGQRYSAKDYDIILIGHEGHPEVIGTMGRIPGKVYLVSTAEDVGKLEVRDPDKLAYVTQTTLSVDDTKDVIEALKVRFPTVVGPDVKDICYATQNRQSAVRELAGQVDLLLVVGAQNSSNSKRLSEIGKELNVPSYLIDDATGLNENWLEDIETLGITAGASAPEKLVQDLIKRLGELVDIEVEEVDGINENVQFKLPKELREAAA
ncbi:MAG: 4-hydroxy-3-methylbut-2-enyl diphosphate reductase [Rhodospirillaceae bacterium]|nr:4-hydroxy-3-methylbut-2-enyl diphosphate reductase [Rhodospirillaceae bacterium]|tara:strand:- start:27 stop:959 length:933 start_codon:yes stop_codon:yes gene_type:complete